MIGSWCYVFCFFFKQKTAYEMRISDWSSDVCSSDRQREEAVKVRKLRLVALSSIAAMAAVTEAHAQSKVDANPEASEVSSLTDIVVTARKREERLQDVPVAVTAITAEGLEKSPIGRASSRERVCQYV